MVKKLYVVCLLAAAMVAVFAMGRLTGSCATWLAPSGALAAQEGRQPGLAGDIPTVLREEAPDPLVPTGLNSSRSSPLALWHAAEPYDDKYVPVVSLLEGTRLGVARVNGPRSRLALTQAVAQFSIRFMDFFDIDIYIPISTRAPGQRLARVPGVGVTGLGDIRL